MDWGALVAVAVLNQEKEESKTSHTSLAVLLAAFNIATGEVVSLIDGIRK